MGRRMEMESELNKENCFDVNHSLEKPVSEQTPGWKVDYSHVRALICGPNAEDNEAWKNLLKQLKIKTDLTAAALTGLRRVKSRLAANYAYAFCILDEQLAEDEQFISGLHEIDSGLFVFIMTGGERQLKIPKESESRCRILDKTLFQSALPDAVMENFGACGPKKRQVLFDFAGACALIAEDNEINADILARVLKKMNVDSVVCENGQLAVERFEREAAGTFDIIFMDIQMPVMNGYDAAGHIRRNPKGRNVPMIAVSANAFPEDVANSMAAGMNEHLSKPVDVRRLGMTIERFLGSHKDEVMGEEQRHE